MEVGKKYRPKSKYGANTSVFTIEAVLSNGAFVGLVKTPGQLDFVSSPDKKGLENFWEEIKDPEVRYVHWLKSKISGEFWVFISSSDERHNSKRYDYIKVDKVSCDV